MCRAYLLRMECVRGRIRRGTRRDGGRELKGARREKFRERGMEEPRLENGGTANCNKGRF